MCSLRKLLSILKKVDGTWRRNESKPLALNYKVILRWRASINHNFRVETNPVFYFRVRVPFLTTPSRKKVHTRN